MVPEPAMTRSSQPSPFTITHKGLLEVEPVAENLNRRSEGAVAFAEKEVRLAAVGTGGVSRDEGPGGRHR